MALSKLLKKYNKNKYNEGENDNDEVKLENDPNYPTKINNNYYDDIKLETAETKDKKKNEYQFALNEDKYQSLNPDPKKLITTMKAAKQQKISVYHVVHETNWSGIFDKNILPNNEDWYYKPKKTKKIVEKGKDGFTVELFSPTECKKLVELTELYGYEDCGYPKGYRSNTRLITNDLLFADELYKRIKECCPSKYKSDGFIWQICGLNERFRWCKYIKGQRFGMHCDARFNRSNKEKSFYTVNVYLNNGGGKEFSGGRTCFFNPNKKTRQMEISVGVVATAGLALIFNQHPESIYHNGEELEDGVKYLMRTDVMYKVVDTAKEKRWINGII